MLETDDRADVAEWHRFRAENPTIDSIDVLFTPMSGVPRGKRLRAHEMEAVYTSGRFLPGSLLVTDVNGRDTEETGLVWADGDADRVVKPIRNTLVRQTWRQGAQVLTSMYELDGTPNDLDPRSVLRRVLQRYADDGLTPVLACELEFYLLDPVRTPEGFVQPPILGAGKRRPQFHHTYGLRELDDIAPFIDGVIAAGDAQGVPIEGAISEYAPGQIEIGLTHRDNALRACDEAILFKQIIKAVADKTGLCATFMAKPFAEQAGCGLHIHISINDQAGRNIFASDDLTGTPALKHAIAGMHALMGDSMAIFAPNANSYRRFKANSYAPLAPTWGVNNRTVSLRIPAGGASSRHVEHRLCGADANPYLAVAAILAAAHHGLTHRSDPGAMVTGDGYAHAQALAADDPARLPLSWSAALDRFSRSDVLGAYLGERFQRMFTTVKRVEQQKFEATVTALDYDWYLHTA